MLETLLGATLAILGGWLALRWQNTHVARSLARALLIELESSYTSSEYEAADRYYRFLLTDWIETGAIKDREIILGTVEVPLAERYPVYHANIAAIGALPGSVAERVVRFHALTTSIIATASRVLLATDRLAPDQVKAVASSLLVKYEEMGEARRAAVSALKEFDARPTLVASLRLRRL